MDKICNKKMFAGFFFILFLISGTFASVPVKASSFYWEITYPTTIEVDDFATVVIYVRTEKCIDLHVSFKGYFENPPNYWTGHWTYEEQILTLNKGEDTIHFHFIIPYELMVEKKASPRFQAQYYYFYIWATSEGGAWDDRIADQFGGSDGPWTIYDPTTYVSYPSVDYHKLLTTAIDMIKFKIIPSSLSYGVKQSLLTKLDSAAETIDRAYQRCNEDMLEDAEGKIEAFINELESRNPASTWVKSKECIDLAEFIIVWLDEAK